MKTNRKPSLILLCALAITPSWTIAQTTTTTTPPATRPRVVNPVLPQAPEQKTDAPPTVAPPTQTPTTTSSPSPAAATTQVAPAATVGPNAPTPSEPLAPGLASPSSMLPSFVAVPLQPVKPLPLSRARASITEAQKMLRGRLMPTAMTPSLYFVTIAAMDPETSKIHTITLPKQTFLTKTLDSVFTTSHGTHVRLRIVRSNYVNTAMIISDLSGKQLTPLVVEYPIEKFGSFREMAYYTSAHPALMSPELVKSGQTYVRTMLDLAAKRLSNKGIRVPTSVIDIAERLCLVEHVDHERFLKEDRLSLYNEVYALYALNENDTYRFSVSTAGAGGMVQMIPSTYYMFRQLYPAVGLHPDFVTGMRNHNNALEAMLIYMNHTWNSLIANPDINDALTNGLATQTELMASGYNSNPVRLASYIRRGGEAWRSLIPRETQIYLQIYKSVEALIPMKPRENKLLASESEAGIAKETQLDKKEDASASETIK